MATESVLSAAYRASRRIPNVARGDGGLPATPADRADSLPGGCRPELVAPLLSCSTPELKARPANVYTCAVAEVGILCNLDTGLSHEGSSFGMLEARAVRATEDRSMEMCKAMRGLRSSGDQTWYHGERLVMLHQHDQR